MTNRWNEALMTGVEVMDDQHKGIFTRVHNLLNAMSQGGGKEEIIEIINYVIQHFRAEEKLMSRHNYVSYSKQRTEHLLFIKDFSRIKREYETWGVSSHLLAETQQSLCNWLINHIGNEDKKLGVFLQKCG